MWRKFCNWLLYKRMGWTTEVKEDHPDKFIICLAPHTSNWDFILGLLYSRARGMQCNFMMKKEWFFWPLGPIFKKLGGIPVYRQKKTSMTDAMAEAAKAAKTFHLCIARGYTLEDGRLEEGLLFHRPEGQYADTALWHRL